MQKGDWDRLGADRVAGWPDRWASSWHSGHGADRSGRGPPCPAFGMQVHYHNRRRLRPEIEQELGGDLLGKPRPDGGADGCDLNSLPVYAVDLSSDECAAV